METGWLSPLIEELQSEYSPLGTPVSDMVVSWWATIIPFCGAFLVPICTYLADNFGRKLSIIAVILPEIEAYETVAFLRGLKINDKRVGRAVQYMEKQEEEFKNLPKIGITSILNDKLLRRGFILLVMIFATQAFSGAFVIITYASVILASMGTKLPINPELETVSLPIVMIIASLMLTFIAEKFGRRTLQASGYLISALTFTILATFILLQYYGYATPRWLPIGCMATIVAMYAGTIRPLPFIVATEILHFRVRAKLMGVLTMFIGLMNSVHLISYIPMKTYLGLSATLMIFGICNVFGILFSLLLPETKGKTVEEIRTQIERRMK
ncbi:unnamed protein product [Pieris brassicae]|uniref:Major facilitator superfamily (MFS) profile domain-containing protein n=1 Tax=Pieris brassicae TaxID=7116 RepID=A0A9P0TTM6_PIEBR|nr:unnamed protein product [Pieris brassicae]